MTREEIDTLWQRALHDSVKEGEQFTRYHFAALVLEEAALMAQPANFSHPDDWTEYAKTRAEVACFIRAMKPAKEQKT